MATFNCQCGKELENSKHGDMIYVFYEKEILAACQQVSDLTFEDFLINWRRWALRDNPGVVYWHCPECGRVYESAPFADGEVFRTFERSDREDTVVLTALADFERVFVITADFIANVEENVGTHSLFETIYATRWDYDYFLSPTENMLVALKNATDQSVFVYEDADTKEA